MARRITYAEIVRDYASWQEYFDRLGIDSLEAFKAQDPDAKEQLLTECFGPEPESVDDVLQSTSIGCGMHRWAVEGGSIEVPTDQLREVLEAAYDSGNPNWVALIDYDDTEGFWIA